MLPLHYGCIIKQSTFTFSRIMFNLLLVLLKQLLVESGIPRICHRRIGTSICKRNIRISTDAYGPQWKWCHWPDLNLGLLTKGRGFTASLVKNKILLFFKTHIENLIFAVSIFRNLIPKKFTRICFDRLYYHLCLPISPNISFNIFKVIPNWNSC